MTVEPSESFLTYQPCDFEARILARPGSRCWRFESRHLSGDLWNIMDKVTKIDRAGSSRKLVMKEPSAQQIADYLIAFSHSVGDPISNLKLQKLLYYAQAWYLALHNEPLFPESIEAWVHGPAVPPVYGNCSWWAIKRHNQSWLDEAVLSSDVEWHTIRSIKNAKYQLQP